MKRFSVILLALVISFAMAIPAHAGGWTFYGQDAASVTGINSVCVPAVRSRTFVPTGMSILPKDSAVTLAVYSDSGSYAVASSSRNSGATTLSIVNTTNVDKTVAGQVLYTATDNSSDPMAETIIFLGTVASTAASADRGTEVVTVAGGSGDLAKSARVKIATIISAADILFGTEVDANPVIFSGANYSSGGTWAGVATQFYPIEILTPGRRGKDTCYVVADNASTTTGVIYHLSGSFVNIK